MTSVGASPASLFGFCKSLEGFRISGDSQHLRPNRDGVGPEEKLRSGWKLEMIGLEIDLSVVYFGIYKLPLQNWRKKDAFDKCMGNTPPVCCLICPRFKVGVWYPLDS